MSQPEAAMRAAGEAAVETAPAAPTPGAYCGRVGRVSPDLLAGWALGPDPEAGPAELEVYLDGRFLGGVTADSYREDLAAQDLRGGHCAFFFRPPEGTTLRVEGLQVRFKDSRLVLKVPDAGGGGATDPTVTRLIQIEDDITALAEGVDRRLGRIEQALARGFGADGASGLEGLRQDLRALQEDVETLEAYTSVHLGNRLEETVAAAVNEAVAPSLGRRIDRLRRLVWLALLAWGALAAVLLAWALGLDAEAFNHLGSAVTGS